MKRFPWKAANSVLISCYRIAEHKEEEEDIFYKQCASSRDMEELCGIREM